MKLGCPCNNGQPSDYIAMRFVIIGETPSKKNQRINTRSGRSFPSKRYTEWHAYASAQIMAQKKNPSIIDAPCKIKIHFVHGDMRKRDADNGTNSIFDLLKDCGVIMDDRWEIVQKHKVSNSYEKKNPHCIIDIEIL